VRIERCVAADAGNALAARARRWRVRQAFGNNEGVLSEDEVDESAKVCSGVDGLVDEDKDGVDDRIDVSGGASCAASGGNASVLGLFALVLLAGRRRRR
jgi:uncharacterized protein (TIGR03382 family)